MTMAKAKASKTRQPSLEFRFLREKSPHLIVTSFAFAWIYKQSSCLEHDRSHGDGDKASLAIVCVLKIIN